MTELQEVFLGINESVRVEERPLCMLCGNQGVALYSDLRDRFYAAPGTWNLMRCPKDGLVWLNPQPVPEEIAKLYPEYCTHTVSLPATLRLARLRKAVIQGVLAGALGYNELAKNRVYKGLGWTYSRIGPLREIVSGSVMWLNGSWRGRLLDIGCGNGSLVAPLLDLGWEVTGVEPDPVPAKLAREQFGLKVHEGTLEEVRLPEAYFDVITMHHVIEHLPDPFGTLRECLRLLKPGGKLVIVTPNIEGLGYRVFGNAWSYLDPPRHLTIFSLNTLASCAEEAGFYVMDIHTSPRHAHWVWIDSRSIRREGAHPRGKTKKFLPRIEGLAFIGIEWFSKIGMKNIGEELVLVAMKGRSTCPVS